MRIRWCKSRARTRRHRTENHSAFLIGYLQQLEERTLLKGNRRKGWTGVKNGTFGGLKVSICGYRCDHLQSAAVIKVVKVSLKSAPHMLDVDFSPQIPEFSWRISACGNVAEKKTRLSNIKLWTIGIYIHLQHWPLYKCNQGSSFINLMLIATLAICVFVSVAIKTKTSTCVSTWLPQL